MAPAVAVTIVEKSNQKLVVELLVAYKSAPQLVAFLTYAIKFSDMSMAFDMIYVSDKYDVPTLVAFARKYIVDNLNVENVLRVIELAELHSVQVMALAAMQFVAANWKSVTASEQYVQFRNNQLLKDKLLDYLMAH